MVAALAIVESLAAETLALGRSTCCASRLTTAAARPSRRRTPLPAWCVQEEVPIGLVRPLDRPRWTFHGLHEGQDREPLNLRRRPSAAKLRAPWRTIPAYARCQPCCRSCNPDR